MKKIISILGLSLFMLGCAADTSQDSASTKINTQAEIMYFGATW